MFWDKAEKAKIKIMGKSGKTIEVMFNPLDYSLTSEATFSGEGRKTQFSEFKKQDFTINLFFDTYETKENVRLKTKDIRELPFPSEPKKGGFVPPLCQFTWGKFTYEGYIKKVDEKLTMFLPDGVPVRCELTVTFKYFPSEIKDKENKGQKRCRKYWTIKSGDRLDLIAHDMLGDHTLWKVIAKYNNIRNCIDFPADDLIGTVLIIPDYYDTEETL